MLAGFDQLFSNVPTDVTASLGREIWRVRNEALQSEALAGKSTYPDDGNFLNVVRETLGLILGIRGRHGPR
jgi:hypothetical protein